MRDYSTYSSGGMSQEALDTAGVPLLGIRTTFHNHAPQQLAIGLAFHQQAADEVRGNLLGGAGEEGLGEGWEVLRERGAMGVAMGVAWVERGENEDAKLRS
jgi:hypothetical protein